MVKNDQTLHKGFWRVTGYILLALIFLFLLIQIIINTVAEPWLENKAESALEKEQLRARIANVEISLLQREIQFEDIVLSRKSPSDSTAKGQKLIIDSLSVPRFTFSGIQIWPFLFNNNLNIHSVEVAQPFFKGAKIPLKRDSQDKSGQRKILYERINSFTDALKVDELAVEGLSAELYDSLNSGNRIVSIGNLHLQFTDIQVDSSSIKKNQRPVAAFRGEADSLRLKPVSGLYTFRIQKLLFSSKDSLIKVSNFKMIPRYPRYKFSQKVGHEIDRIELAVNTLEVVDADLPLIVTSQQVKGSKINISQTDLSIFRNKRLPFGKKDKRIFPHLLFRQMNKAISIDSLVISDADISYSEHIKSVPKPGTISFENTSAVFRNFDNTSQDKPVTVDASTEVMGTGTLKVHFNFPHNQTGTHYISGSMGELNMKQLNPASKYLNLIQIKSGKIDSIDFKMELGPQKSEGTMKMDYQNLDLKMIDFGKQGNKEKDMLKTVFADIFVIDEKNTPPLREAKISFERILYRSIFNYWWKSLLSGLKNSIGA